MAMTLSKYSQRAQRWRATAVKELEAASLRADVWNLVERRQGTWVR